MKTILLLICLSFGIQPVNLYSNIHSDNPKTLLEKGLTQQKDEHKIIFFTSIIEEKNVNNSLKEALSDK